MPILIQSIIAEYARVKSACKTRPSKTLNHYTRATVDRNAANFDSLRAFDHHLL